MLKVTKIRKTTKDSKDCQRHISKGGPGWPRKLPGCLKEVNIFDFALGAT